MTRLRVALRCDAHAELGVGHLARCVALAQEARAQGHDPVLVGRFSGPVSDELIARADLMVRLELPSEVDVVHVDSYTDAAAYVAPLLSRVHDGRFGVGPAALATDPTPGADRRPRPQGLGPEALRLAGERYALLRPDVLAARAARHPKLAGAPARPLVVTVVVGGTDPGALRGRLVEALRRTGLRLDVRGPGPTLVADLAASDLVVSAAGTTLWEAFALGAPTAAVCAVDNQEVGYAAAVGARATVGLGHAGELDPDATANVLSALLTDEPERRRMASRAAALVDGLGAWRLVSSWSALLDRPVHARRADEGTLTLRPAERSDAPLLLAWRNDPQARRWSRASDPVDPEHHERWLTDSLSRSDRVLLVATDAAGPVGTVRWDRADHLDPSISHDRPDEWEVSITLAPNRRGAGLALDVLRAGEEYLAARHPVTAYLALVHDDNRASRRLFARAGYLPDRPADVDGFARLVAFARG